MPPLPSDEQLKIAVNQILSQIDFDTTSLRTVLNMVADHFSLTSTQLIPKKPFVRSIIDAHLNLHYAQEEQQEQEQQQQHQQHQQQQQQQDPTTSTATPPTAAVTSSAAGDVTAASAPQSPPRKRAKRDTRLSSLERAVVATDSLAKFLDERVMPRSHITKRISAYVRENKLETIPGGDERRYVCDETLRKALGVDNFTYYELSKLLSTLVRKPTECSEEMQQLATECDERLLRDKREFYSRPKPEGERRGAGLQRPMKLSPALAAVCNEQELPRGGVVKKIWLYIRENELKDKNDPMKVRCDDKLKAVFDNRDYIVAMDVNKYIGGHMSKLS